MTTDGITTRVIVAAEEASFPAGPLSDPAAQLLDVAAVFGQPFSVGEAADVVGQTVPEVLPAAREALAAGVLVPAAELLTFRRPEARASVYGAIPEPILLALHRQVGTVLLRRGGFAAAAATHLLKGTQRGDRRAVVVLHEVAQELLETSPRAAADLASRALELTHAGDDEWFPRTATAVEALVATGSSGATGAAIELARAALTSPVVPDNCAARLRVTLSSIFLMDGQPAIAAVEAEAVLAMPGIPGDLRGQAQLGQLLARLSADDFPAAQACAEKVLAGDGQEQDDLTLAGALAGLAFIAWDQGAVGMSLGLIRSAVRRADRSGGRWLHPRLGLAWILTALGEFDEAADVIGMLAEEVDRTADALWTTAPPLARARLSLASGRPEEALTQVRAVLRTAADVGTRVLVPLALATASQAALLLGDLPEADRCLEECRAHARVQQTRLHSATAAWAAGRLVEAESGPAAAMDVMPDVYAWILAHPALMVEDPGAAAWLTRLALDVGDRTQAEAVVACAAQLAASNPGFPTVVAAAEHARGELARDPGLLDRAAAGHRHPWAKASAAEDAGRARARAGDRCGARHAFEQALVAYGEGGGERDAARMRSRLRSLGVRHRHWSRAPRPTSGWDSLTDTENRVAGLVAAGLTNAQAADRLYLSRHTVDFHLRQIFRKLDIRSRVDLARLMSERGIGGLTSTSA